VGRLDQRISGPVAVEVELHAPSVPLFWSKGYRFLL
jgi:hypothetical protein